MTDRDLRKLMPYRSDTSEPYKIYAATSSDTYGSMKEVTNILVDECEGKVIFLAKGKTEVMR